jgi:hypothetical protein
VEAVAVPEGEGVTVTLPTTEPRIGVSAAAALVSTVGATRSHRTTVVRWITRGVLVRGERVKLPAERVGGVWVTTAGAVGRFLALLTAKAAGEEPTSPTRTPAAARRASAAAARELEAAGW